MKKNDKIFLYWLESTIQISAKNLINRKLNPKELRFLKEKIITTTHNLIVKIGSSGAGQ